MYHAVLTVLVGEENCQVGPAKLTQKRPIPDINQHSKYQPVLMVFVGRLENKILPSPRPYLFYKMQTSCGQVAIRNAKKTMSN